MPSASEIHAMLAQSAERWIAVAIAWHAIVIAAIVAVVMGWRPSRRLAGVLLTMPLITVAFIALEARNPFNTIVPLALALILIAIASRMKRQPISFAPDPVLLVGSLMMIFGMVYPHFLAGRSGYIYLIAAPTGIVPCPTLAVIIGATLMLDGLRSRPYSLALAAWGMFYGLFGAFVLDVWIDLVLLTGAGALLVVALTPQAGKSM